MGTQKGMTLATDMDFIPELWADRPPMSASRAWILADAYAIQ